MTLFNSISFICIYVGMKIMAFTHGVDADTVSSIGVNHEKDCIACESERLTGRKDSIKGFDTAKTLPGNIFITEQASPHGGGSLKYSVDGGDLFKNKVSLSDLELEIAKDQLNAQEAQLRMLQLEKEEKEKERQIAETQKNINTHKLLNKQKLFRNTEEEILREEKANFYPSLLAKRALKVMVSDGYLSFIKLHGDLLFKRLKDLRKKELQKFEAKIKMEEVEPATKALMEINGGEPDLRTWKEPLPVDTNGIPLIVQNTGKGNFYIDSSGSERNKIRELNEHENFPERALSNSRAARSFRIRSKNFDLNKYNDAISKSKEK